MNKCGILTKKRGRAVGCEGIAFPDSEVMEEVKKEGYTYLGRAELNKITES